MSKYSNYLKSLKEKRIEKYFGEVKYTSNKYFTFNQIIDEDNFILITNNVRLVKNSPVLVIGNNKVVYLKDYQLENLMNWSRGIYTYAVKLNRNYFKIYTFQNEFEGFMFDEDETFDSLLEVAKIQNEAGLEWANTWGALESKIDWLF